jgi:hypothetical protein
MRLVWLQLRAYPVEISTRSVIAMNVLSERVAQECIHDHPIPVPSNASDGELALRSVSQAFTSSIGLVGIYRFGCYLEKLADNQLTKLNQWVYMATVLVIALFCRFLTSSWTIALTAAAVVLSRGRILSELGHVSDQSFLLFGFSSWMCCAAHFLRTGSSVTLGATVFMAMICALLDRSLMVLMCAFPALLVGGYLFRKRLARPVLQRLRQFSRARRVPGRMLGDSQEGAQDGAFSKLLGTVRYALGMEFPAKENESAGLNYERGSLVRTIEVPFALWAYANRRWVRLSLGWIGMGFVLLALSFWLYAMVLQPYLSNSTDVLINSMNPTSDWAKSNWATIWFQNLWSPFDLHLTVSMIVILVCAFQSPADGLVGFLEASWLLIVALVGVTIAAFLADYWDWMLLGSLQVQGVENSVLEGLTLRPVYVWSEPIILALGICGVYNLLKVIDTRYR